eukprot:CAMPEP_0113909732 /NCGR_PEP_ID=MMETSP0780_2-20120614/27054_1 /TAXON_ID=652834 /ORGANISM="Palpitomonas bilix" /LENGTH=141 /DNA_ID=CAMNT_0000905651 /DNA_START=150 /DNA_END=571 /DNA_ORIENTATION=+ /assembly_acc=CAM_ASM_000599
MGRKGGDAASSSDEDELSLRRISDLLSRPKSKRAARGAEMEALSRTTQQMRLQLEKVKSRESYIAEEAARLAKALKDERARRLQLAERFSECELEKKELEKVLKEERFINSRLTKELADTQEMSGDVTEQARTSIQRLRSG